MIKVGGTALGALLLVVGVSPGAAPLVSWHEWARKSEGRFPYSVLMGGKKIGWIIEETKIGKLAGRPVVESIVDEYSETLFDGERSVKKERSVTCYEMYGDGVIVLYDCQKTEDGKTTRRQAVRVGDKLRITNTVGNRKLTREVALPRDTLAHSRQLEEWLESSRKAGDRFTKYSVNWENTDINSKQEYLFRSRKKMLVHGRMLDVAQVQITVEGGKMEAHVLADNRTITADVGKIMSIRLDREDTVKKLSAQPVELMDLITLSVNKRLGRAAHVHSLTLEVSGLDDFKIPTSHRQSVRESKGATLVDLRKDYRLEKATPLSAADRKRFLKSSPRIQCDVGQVVRLAAKITGTEKDPLKKARLIVAWIEKNLEQSYSANADTTLEILDNKAGDCTEHTLLFVALCRATGVPAREVSGLAYMDGKKPSFGWHAWAEIHDGHQWVSVDPTWHQVYVDGTHLKLSEGDRDLAWTNVLGTLKIKIVSVKTDK